MDIFYYIFSGSFKILDCIVLCLLAILIELFLCRHFLRSLLMGSSSVGMPTMLRLVCAQGVGGAPTLFQCVVAHCWRKKVPTTISSNSHYDCQCLHCCRYFMANRQDTGGVLTVGRDEGRREISPAFFVWPFDMASEIGLRHAREVVGGKQD